MENEQHLKKIIPIIVFLLSRGIIVPIIPLEVSSIKVYVDENIQHFLQDLEIEICTFKIKYKLLYFFKKCDAKNNSLKIKLADNASNLNMKPILMMNFLDCSVL